ncbi:MAG TPA: hypothetical protein PKW90_25605, partial [Myxococcota bacterium]|nr:hypothetical protein [Myxococcota bacterium]
MPDPKRFLVYFEGDVDRAVLAALERAGGLPPRLELAKKQPRQGQEAVVAQVGGIAAASGLHGVLCLDLDDRDPERLGTWAAAQLASHGAELAPASHERVRLLRVGVGAVAIVPVGLPRPAHPLLAEWELLNATMDDYLVRLCAEP